jgi:hypothetical protein
MSLIILLSLAAGVLGWEMCYSTLAMWLKNKLYLDKKYEEVQVLRSYSTYKQITKEFHPFVQKIAKTAAFVIIPVLAIHNYFYKLLECNYCTSFWVGVIITLVLGLSPTLSFIIPLLSMFSSGLYNKLRS